MHSLSLSTARLHLRPIQPPDEALLHALWTNPGVRKYLWDDAVIPIEKVKEIRSQSNREATKKLAEFPMLFGEIRQPKTDYILCYTRIYIVMN